MPYSIVLHGNYVPMNMARPSALRRASRSADVVEGSTPLGEFELIERFFVRSKPNRLRTDVCLGIGDDAALLRVPANCELVAAVDTLVAGRHFVGESPPRSIGHRALAVNLSDMAAMGATPAWFTLALTLPSAEAGWLQEFSHGLMALADSHDVALVGGDTTGGPLTVSVQILGYVAQGTALRRGGARAGDLLVVTGTLGDAGAGLALTMGHLMAQDRTAADEVIARFEYPGSRVAFGCAARGVASAAMDLSDGLTGDLPKLAAASGLAAEVWVECLPLSAALRALVPVPQARDWALSAGEDYELLLAVAPKRFDALRSEAADGGLNLTVIGELRPGDGVRFTLEGAPFVAPSHGYDHFR